MVNLLKFFSLLKGDINSYCLNFKNDNIDLVYIDGNHKYNYVRNDLLKTIQYIKPAYISGHDYFENNSNDYLEGVFRAVDEIIGLPDKCFCDHSWVKKL